MTNVAFHLNVGDVGAYACRLLRKAYLKGARVKVLTSPEQVPSLTRQLWTIGQGDFVPHATASASPRVRERSPILIGTDASNDAGATVLLNLGGGWPGRVEDFDRVIEVVGLADADRQRARERWKSYRAAGFTPEAVDLSVKKGA